MCREEQEGASRASSGNGGGAAPLPSGRRPGVEQGREADRRRQQSRPRPRVTEEERGTAVEQDRRSRGERVVDQMRERGVTGRGLAGTVSSPNASPAPATVRSAGTSSTGSLLHSGDASARQVGAGPAQVGASGPGSPAPASVGREGLPIMRSPNMPSPARRTIRTTYESLTELNNRYFRHLWNRTAERITRDARSVHDAPLARLRSRFVRLMGQYPNGITNRRDWEEARRIFDEAYRRARERGRGISRSMWRAVWADAEATRRLRELERHGLVRINLNRRGEPTGAPQIRQYIPSSNRWRWVPINIDHAVPLERNPWGVLERDNLVATTPYVNQRFLRRFSRHSAFPMAVNRFGGRGDVNNSIEEFVMANSLSRQRRATAAELDAYFGSSERSRARSRTRSRARSRTIPHNVRRRTRVAGLSRFSIVPFLGDFIEQLITGETRRGRFRRTVERLRARHAERQRRRGRERIQISLDSVHPRRLRRTYDRVVGMRPPEEVYQLNELRRQFQRWVEQWDRANGEGWRIASIVFEAREQASPGRRDRILNDWLVVLIDHMRELETVYNSARERRNDENWMERARRYRELAELTDSLLEDQIQTYGIDMQDAEYLSNMVFRRRSEIYSRFYNNLTLLMGLLFEMIQRYRRMIDQVSLLTTQ